jgi:hypothetical protein
MANAAYLLEQGHCLHLNKLDCEKAALKYYKLLNEQHPKGEYNVKVRVQTEHTPYCKHPSVCMSVQYMISACRYDGVPHLCALKFMLLLHQLLIIVACVDQQGQQKLSKCFDTLQRWCLACLSEVLMYILLINLWCTLSARRLLL